MSYNLLTRPVLDYHDFVLCSRRRRSTGSSTISPSVSMCGGGALSLIVLDSADLEHSSFLNRTFLPRCRWKFKEWEESRSGWLNPMQKLAIVIALKQRQGARTLDTCVGLLT